MSNYTITANSTHYCIGMPCALCNQTGGTGNWDVTFCCQTCWTLPCNCTSKWTGNYIISSNYCSKCGYNKNSQLKCGCDMKYGPLPTSSCGKCGTFCTCKIVEMVENYMNKENEVKSVDKGWQCPVCEKVMAPWARECSKCVGKDK